MIRARYKVKPSLLNVTSRQWRPSP